MLQDKVNKNERINHFEAIFYCATLGIVVTDMRGKIKYVNPFALKEFGYAEEELIGKKVEILVPPRFHESHSVHHKNFIAEPQTRLMGAGKELFAVRKDGSEFPVEISLSTYENHAENYVISFVNNISVRKKAQKVIENLHDELEATVERRTRELKLAKEKAEELMAFQKAILDNAGAMIISTDEKGCIKYFNPEASLNIGYSQAEVVNKQTPVLFHDQHEIRMKKAVLLKEWGMKIDDDFSVLVAKAARGIRDEEKYTYIRKDGTSFPVSLAITAIKNKQGVISGFMGIAIDITERVKAEEDLLKALEKEKELNDLKTRFISIASHEFRTPLSTVLSSSYLIEKYTKTEDQPKREKHLQRIVSSVNMLTDILNDFLSLGKIEEGKISVKPSRFNIHEYITKVTGDLRSALKPAQKIYYQHEGATDVTLDPLLFRHIILNLLSNASKFSPENSPIEMKTSCCGNRLILSVKDLGIGIPEQDREHLMERFYRGINAGNIQGTGLGLHIIAKYAELMNGTVEYKSELDKGTEFIITFIVKPDSHEKDFAD